MASIAHLSKRCAVRLSIRLCRVAILPLLVSLGCKTDKQTSVNKSQNLLPSRTILVDGISINYTASLEKHSDSTIVLVHGFGASLETWYDVYPMLSRDYNVVALDLKGSGFSSKPEDGKYGPRDQANLLASFLRKMKFSNVVLAGHSLGGGISLLTFLQSPRNPRIKSLILIDSAGYPQKVPFFVAEVRNPLTRGFSYLMSPESRARYVLRRIFCVKSQLTSDRIHRYSFFLDLPGSRYALTQTAKSIEIANLADLNLEFRSIDIPTLIIWGEDDPAIPLSNGRRFAADIKGARLVVVPGAGHVPHEECPSMVFGAINQFLEQLK